MVSSMLERGRTSSANTSQQTRPLRVSKMRYRRGVMSWLDDGIVNVANEMCWGWVCGFGRSVGPISPDPR
jgi:hypothetical protein